MQRQLEAYNAKDLTAFVACYHSDIAIYRMPATAPSLVGREALETGRFTIAAEELHDSAQRVSNQSGGLICRYHFCVLNIDWVKVQ